MDKVLAMNLNKDKKAQGVGDFDVRGVPRPRLWFICIYFWYYLPFYKFVRVLYLIYLMFYYINLKLKKSFLTRTIDTVLKTRYHILG